MNTIMIKLTFHYSAIKPSVKSNFYKNKYQLTFHYSAIKPKNFLGTLDLAFKLTFHYSAIKPIFDRDMGDKFDSINILL